MENMAYEKIYLKEWFLLSLKNHYYVYRTEMAWELHFDLMTPRLVRSVRSGSQLLSWFLLSRTSISVPECGDYHKLQVPVICILISS